MCVCVCVCVCVCERERERAKKENKERVSKVTLFLTCTISFDKILLFYLPQGKSTLISDIF